MSNITYIYIIREHVTCKYTSVSPYKPPHHHVPFLFDLRHLDNSWFHQYPRRRRLARLLITKDQIDPIGQHLRYFFTFKPQMGGNS